MELTSILSKNILRNTLILCSIILLVVQLKFICQQAWSPIDEYAHFDYIEKIGKGIMPKISDTLEEEIYHDILQHPSRNVKGMAQSKHELGIANYSYQAKHPPLYYILLAVPNELMKMMHQPLFTRLLLLRIIGFLLFTLGTFILIPIRRKLNALGYFIPEYYPYLAIIFSLFIISHERYGLGNNMLSAILVNAVFLALLKYLEVSNLRNLFLLSFLCGLSITGSLTNLFILPIIFAIALPQFVHQLSFKSIVTLLTAFILPCLLLLHWHLHSKPDPVIANYFNGIIQSAFRAGVLDGMTFLKLLVSDCFTIDLFAKKSDMGFLFTALFLCNNFILILQYKKLKRAELRWLIYSYFIFIYFILLVLFLNRNVDNVTWVAFRHYVGFIPFIFIPLSSSLLLFSNHLTQKKI